MDTDKIISNSGTCSIDLTDLAQNNTVNWGVGTNTTDTITISSSPYIFSNTGPNVPVWSDNLWADSNSSGKISLRGESADIDVNGVSLMDTLKTIQDRLNMLCPNPEMEAEWNELRKIREQYEAKLKECQEKSRAWKALKQKG